MKPATASAVLTVAIAAIVAFGVAASGRQVSPTPRPGTGSVTVDGEVNVKGDVRVVNEASVAARQTGPWRVGVEGPVAISPQMLPFVRIGGSYQIQWADRSIDGVVVREVFGSWVRADSGDSAKSRPRWVNLAAALTVEERTP
jgi:hypothetical protein